MRNQLLSPIGVNKLLVSALAEQTGCNLEDVLPVGVLQTKQLISSHDVRNPGWLDGISLLV